jgi:hypothetical protein
MGHETTKRASVLEPLADDAGALLASRPSLREPYYAHIFADVTRVYCIPEFVVPACAIN